MKNIFIFPFQKEHIPLIRFQKQFNKEINIVPVLEPYNLEAKHQLELLDNGEKVNYTNVDIDESKDEDKFCFVCGDGSISSLKFGVSIAKKILGTGKFVDMYLQKSDLRRLFYLDQKFLETYGINSDIKKIMRVRSENQEAKLQKIKVPIIAVGSIVAENNKKEVALTLMLYYKSQGKKVKCVLSDELYDYLNLYTINYEKLFQYGLNIMLVYINNYFNMISKDCDVIICDIPGGLMQYNSEHLDSAGVYSYIITRALNISELVCCTPLSHNSIDYYKRLAEYFYKKFDIRQVYFHMSNFLIEARQRPITERMPQCCIEKREYERVLNAVNKPDKFIYDLRKKSEIEKLLG